MPESILSFEVFGSLAYGLATATSSDIDVALLLQHHSAQPWLRHNSAMILEEITVAYDAVHLKYVTCVLFFVKCAYFK